MTLPDTHVSFTEARLKKAGIGKELLPRHIAVIMDGNGRWANTQGKDRIMGHARGAQILDPIITEVSNLDIEQITLYTFSTENWKRPENEINFLMQLSIENLRSKLNLMLENNICFKHLGRREELPQPVLDELDKAIDLTKNNTGLTLALALNYSSRTEITDAAQAIANDVKSGDLAAENIDEKTISDYLYTQGMPDPDLMIRTGGEMRISNYLLWQISYAELYITDVLWPEFTLDEFYLALQEFAQRHRRFGGVNSITGAVDQDII